MGGYCHGPLGSGSFIEIADVRVFNGEVDRLTGEENLEKFGDLTFADLEWKYREAFLNEAEIALQEAVFKESEKPLDLNESPLERYLEASNKYAKSNLETYILI